MVGETERQVAGEKAESAEAVQLLVPAHQEEPRSGEAEEPKPSDRVAAVETVADEAPGAPNAGEVVMGETLNQVLADAAEAELAAELHAAEAQEQPRTPAFIGVVHATSPQARAAAGKALRDKVPRQAHAKWKRPEGRRDPIEVLRESDEDRLPDLIPIRYGRMLQSPFAFYRGSAGLMAADLASTPTTGIHVQACGDAHLMNFGGFATPERNILFDINDFDETAAAPWEWDVKRLATSFVLAARSNGLPDAAGRDAAMACVRAYRKRSTAYAGMSPLDVWYARITTDDIIGTLPPRAQKRVTDRIAKVTAQGGAEMDFPKLAHMIGGKVAIRDTPPLIFHPQETQTAGFEQLVEESFTAYRNMLTDDRRILLDRYRLVDAAFKVVGVGSVGRRCLIGLLMSASNDPLFLQFKEAVPSVLEPYAGKSPFAQHGERVVKGQRLMQPASDIFLGWFTSPNGRHFYTRQLRDAKVKPLVETFDEEMLLLYAKACGWVLARAHAKAGDAATISGYLGSGPHFDEALGDFAVAYANQAERDHAALKAAVRNGKVKVFTEA
jgi:uncharacterized protein (DUF2252 family)